MKERRPRHGRGRNYAAFREAMERVIEIVFCCDWPGYVWGRLPGTCRVRVVRHTFLVHESVCASPLTMGFISDLHIGPGTPVKLLENAFSALSDENPDVLLLGGDYVFLDTAPSRMLLLGSLVSRVRAGCKLAVLGNHDLWTNDSEIEKTLQSQGVRIITNDAAFLPPPYDRISVIGLDEPYAGEPDEEKALSASKGALYRIALCHSPQGAFGLLGKVEIFLAGHTHGGQVSLPGGIPIILPPGKGCKKWPGGRYSCSGTQIIVTRGVGGTELPVRTFSRPEVIILRLSPYADK